MMNWPGQFVSVLHRHVHNAPNRHSSLMLAGVPHCSATQAARRVRPIRHGYPPDRA